MSILKDLFSKKPDTIYRSIANGDLEVIKRYLATSPNIDADFETEGILQYAIDNCENNYEEVIRFLINNYDDLDNSQSSMHDTPLHRLCARVTPHIDLIALLLERGADVNAMNISGRTPLFYCTFSFSKELLTLLASYGADVNAVDKHGNTFLHEDFLGLDFENFEEFLTALLELGYNINAKNPAGYTPLGFCKNEKFAEILKKHGAVE
jgi:ankyrin repeat protein